MSRIQGVCWENLSALSHTSTETGMKGWEQGFRKDTMVDIQIILATQAAYRNSCDSLVTSAELSVPVVGTTPCCHSVAIIDENLPEN